MIEKTCLDWLAQNTNCELSHGYPDEDSDGEWRVHRKTGNRNDREWILIGRGETPVSALYAAMRART